MNALYCTVGDHFHDQHESPITKGKWAGHFACPTCFVGHQGEADNSDAKKAAWIKKLRELTCPYCKVGWKRCEDPTGHRTRALADPRYSADVKGSIDKNTPSVV